jgi:hypothetical protein
MGKFMWILLRSKQLSCLSGMQFHKSCRDILRTPMTMRSMKYWKTATFSTLNLILCRQTEKVPVEFENISYLLVTEMIKDDIIDPDRHLSLLCLILFPSLFVSLVSFSYDEYILRTTTM